MPMNCRKVLSRLHAYVDGEMPAKLMSDMEEHLGTCPSCRIQVECIRGIHNALDSLTVPPLPGEFKARVVAEARRRALPAREKKFLFLLDRQPLQRLSELSVSMRLAACAMVLLACLLGLFMGREVSLSEVDPAVAVNTESMDGLDWFSPTPPESLGSAYLTLALTSSEDRGAP
jgi:anti-sigma factor RsiW